MNTLVESLAAALAMAAGTMAVAAPPTSTAQDITITLHIVDEAHVPAARLKGAEERTMQIFRDAGVRVLWTYNQPGVGPATPAPADGGFWIRLLRGAAEQRWLVDGHLPQYALAFAPEGEDRARGRDAFILMDRLSAHADERRTPLVWLLGEVMAHEVGHLLLPVNSHGTTGIMRAGMPAGLVTTPAFTNKEAALIRRRLSDESQ